MLRKTMVEECKGDKFMEVLVVFSTSVVQKIALPQLPIYQKPVALQYAANTILDSAEASLLIPLAIAHGSSLNGLLRRKTGIKARCQQFSSLLSQKSDQLTQRTMICNNAEPSNLKDEDLANIEKHIKGNWPGNSQWPHTLLYGDDTNAGDLPLKRSFPDVWSVIVSGDTPETAADSTGLVQDLERRITDQQSRLQKWRSYHKDLSQNALSNAFSKSFGIHGRSRTGFEFERHLVLKLKHNQPKTGVSGGRYIMNAKLENIVANLHQRIEEVSRPKIRAIEPLKALLPMESVAQKSRSASVSSSNFAARQMSYNHHRGLSGTVGMTHSSTSVPLSRVFSPYKSFRLNGRSASASSTEMTASSTTTQTSVPDQAEPTPPPTPKVVLPDEEEDDRDDNSQLGASNVSDLDGASSHSGDDLADEMIDSLLNAQATPILANRMSLAERTRQSISQANLNIQNSHLLPLPGKSSAKEAHHATAVIAHGTVEQRRSSLLERTQQSMMNMEGQSRSRKSLSIRKSRNSIAFPVNQFETPGRPRPQSLRHATPTEKLFSEEADYTSVFKSRPRVAYSPGPSPSEEDLPEHGETIYEEIEDDSMMENVDGDSWIRSSPLRGRG